MIQGILFDFNGVILDDEPLQCRAYQEVLAARGIVLTEREYYDSLGMDDQTFARRALERAGRGEREGAVREVVEAKSEALHRLLSGGLPLFPGAVEFVRRAARELALGIVSMARRADIEAVLERAGIAKEFRAIVSAEDVSRCKPDPSCYRLGRERIGVDASACLAIEDSPPGVRSARAAGLGVLGVTNTVSAGALREAGARAVTASLAGWELADLRRMFE